MSEKKNFVPEEIRDRVATVDDWFDATMNSIFENYTSLQALDEDTRQFFVELISIYFYTAHEIFYEPKWKGQYTVYRLEQPRDQRPPSFEELVEQEIDRNYQEMSDEDFSYWKVVSDVLVQAGIAKNVASQMISNIAEGIFPIFKKKVANFIEARNRRYGDKRKKSTKIFPGKQTTNTRGHFYRPNHLLADRRVLNWKRIREIYEEHEEKKRKEQLGDDDAE